MLSHHAIIEKTYEVFALFGSYIFSPIILSEMFSSTDTLECQIATRDPLFFGERPKTNPITASTEASY